MLVWCAVVASITFMYMVSPQYEFSDAVRIILAVICIGAYIGGMICDSNRQDKIKKLENEINKLKKSST